MKRNRFEIRNTWILGILVMILIISTSNTAIAIPLTNGNILVSTNDVVYEYTTSGAQLQTVNVPYGGGSRPVTENARDIVLDQNEKIAVYNGTFDPYLSTYDPNSDAWTHSTYTGWSTANNGSYGGIGSYQNYIYVTDMRTFGDGGADEAKGIVRFDINNYSAQRFADTIDFIDLTIGLDGLLYALYPGGSPSGRFVDVYDPLTLSYLRTIDLTVTFGHTEHRSIAVNASGELFVADWDGDLQKLDSNGNLLLSTNLLCGISNCSIYDIDVSVFGKLVVGSRFGDVILLDESLTILNTFQVGSHGTFVSFISTVPEPTVINDLVTFEPDPSTYLTTSDTSSCPEGFVGKFSFEARLENTSTETLSHLMCECVTLTNENLFNADGETYGEGETLTIPNLYAVAR